MSNDQEIKDASKTAAFSALRRIVKPGQTVLLHLSHLNKSYSYCGILQDLQPSGLTIENEFSIEWFPAEIIQSWSLPKKGNTITTSPNLTSNTFSSDALVESEEPNNKTTTISHTDATSRTLIRQEQVNNLPTPADLELLFSGNPSISIPKPSFNSLPLNKELLPDITRWRNRYDYSEKVREPARLSQDVTRIAELAETLSEPSLYYLAGLVADYSGLSTSSVKTYLKKTLELDQNHQGATKSLAAFSIRENDWAKAIGLLLWAVRVDVEANKTELVRTIGQCILQQTESIVSPIGLLLKLDLPEAAQRLARSLIALAVKTDDDAYIAALSGDVEQLRRTKIGNDLFPWKDEISPPIEPKKLQPTKVSNSASIRRGRISAYYPLRNFGFLVEEITGQTWFFHKSEVISPPLMLSLTAGNVRQDVTFSGTTNAISGKYPLACKMNVLTDDISSTNETTKRAPLILRLQAIPKDASHFARAMESEQLDQLDRAESLYREEIQKRGAHAKSAIKNLAALINRKGKPESAIEILDKYQSLFGTNELTSLDQMRVQFLVKAKKYGDAAKLLSRLAKNINDRDKRLIYLRQEAFCILATGDVDLSINILNTILKSNPFDNASQLLLEKARETKETGIVTVGFSSNNEEDEYGALVSGALGLSQMARRQIENCELRGIDTRTKESGIFQSQDIKSVLGLLDRVRGRRPRERADYLLTLAWLCEHASNVTENRSIHDYLRRHFLAIAEATMSENYPNDSVRCYALESLMLCPGQIEIDKGAGRHFEDAWVLLLGTYLPNKLEPSALLKPDPGKRLPNVLKILMPHKEEWGYFLHDAPFYQNKAPYAYEHLINFCQDFNDLHLTTQHHTEERTRVKNLENALKCISSDVISADGLRRAKEMIAEQLDSVVFELDRKRLGGLVKILGDTSDYSLERHFRERETKLLRIEAEINRHIEELQRFPTHLSIERLMPALSSLLELLKADFYKAATSKPNLELKNVLDNDYYIIHDGSVALRLQLSSKDEDSPPIEAIGLVLEHGDGDPCHSPDPLHGGQTREIELVIRPSTRQLNDGAFSVKIAVEYRNRKGDIEKSHPFSLAVRLGEQSLDEIPNPYGRYAGGSPVEDTNMFFGRIELIERVTQYLSSGTQGQCFVLYGQKRSGKSSVLKQVEKRLISPIIFAQLSAGTFKPGQLWTSFARLLLQELTFRLEDLDLDIPENWPNRSDVNDNPLESVRDMARKLAKRGHLLVIAIDEFTYIYENTKEDIEEFMRGWKALLEAKSFNALLVGQDTMPRFKQAFPNEFGVTHDERISYLTEEESSQLVSTPILLNGSSRYRGQAIHRLFDLTAGSPFFLQITCDRLVRHLNSHRAAFVTEADVDQVSRALTVGNEALPSERFDALVTAAGEKVATIPRNDLWRVLGRIARESLHSGWCYKDALIDQPNSFQAVKDLVDREILLMEGERVSIRVGLFAAWLRANQQME